MGCLHCCAKHHSPKGKVDFKCFPHLMRPPAFCSIINRADVYRPVLSREPALTFRAFVCKLWFANAKRGFVHWLRMRKNVGKPHGRSHASA